MIERQTLRSVVFFVLAGGGHPVFADREAASDGRTDMLWAERPAAGRHKTGHVSGGRLQCPPPLIPRGGAG